MLGVVVDDTLETSWELAFVVLKIDLARLPAGREESSVEVILWSAEWEWTLDWTQGEGEVQAELFICFLEGDSNWKDTNLFRETIQEDQPTEFDRKLWEFSELSERHFGERLDQNVEGLLRLCDRRIVRRMRSQDERGARIDSGARR